MHYVSPTDDNSYQTEKMKDHGIFSDVSHEVGQIIVADVNSTRVSELLDSDSQALMRLIEKQDGVSAALQSS